MTTTHLVTPAEHPAAVLALPRALLLTLLLAIVVPRSTPAADATWIEFPPPTRLEHAAIYDAVRDRMLVFGGRQGCMLYSNVLTLAVTGAPTWLEVATEGAGPSARAGHTLIYDPVRDRAILFGGNDGANRNDVWELSLTGAPEWTLLTPAGTPPAPRSQHTAVYDPIGDRILVFGGSTNEVWELALGGTLTWNQLAPSGGPPPAMVQHCAIFDPVRNRMLVFSASSRLWELALDGSPAWTEIHPPGPQPQGRFGHTVTYDPVRDRAILLGGTQSGYDSGTYDAWALPLSAGAAWQSLPNHSRWWHSAVYDPMRDCVIVFGGREGSIGAFGSQEDNGTWKLLLAGPTWQPYFEAQAPIISTHTAIYDPDGDRMLVYGGLLWAFILDISPIGGLWSYSLGDNPEWSYGGEGPTRGDHSAIHDPARQRMLVFGGDTYYGPRLNDVYALSLPNLQWSLVSTTGTLPAKRRAHTAIYDPVRDRMLVFGGIDSPMLSPSGTRMNDAWALQLGNNAWTPLSPLGSPPSPRENHIAVYDPLGDRMIVFGGRDAVGLKNDLWELALAGQGMWSSLEAAGTPPSPREMHSAVYDPLAHRMLVFGDEYDPAVWVLDLSDPKGIATWSVVDTEGLPPAGRQDHTAVYDPTGYRLAVFGGECFNTYGPSVFALDMGEVTVGMGDAPPVSDFSLRVLSNPVSKEIAVAFSLPTAALTVLELIDVSGRRVARRDLGTAGPGSSTVTLSGRRPTSGTYFVRLTHAGRAHTTKVSIVP